MSTMLFKKFSIADMASTPAVYDDKGVIHTEGCPPQSNAMHLITVRDDAGDGLKQQLANPLAPVLTCANQG